MSKHSFICNSCIYYNRSRGKELDKEKCNKCNGQGEEWQPINKTFYNKDHLEFMKNLIMGSQ